MKSLLSTFASRLPSQIKFLALQDECSLVVEMRQLSSLCTLLHFMYPVLRSLDRRTLVPGLNSPSALSVKWLFQGFSNLSYSPLLITLIARPLFCASRCARLSSAHPCAEQARIGGRWSSAICLRWPIDAPLPNYILNGCTSPVHHDHPLGGRRRLSQKKSIGGRGEFGELERRGGRRAAC